VVCYVNGFTIEEQSRPSGGRADRDAGFRAGLELILAGARAQLGAGPTGPGPTGDRDR
jgi:hypothetical protein